MFVGHDPAKPKIPFPRMAKKRTHELYRERTAAYAALLRAHFADVKIVHAADYTVAMSDGVDVTVFDSTPKALSPARRTRDPRTGRATYAPARYLPRSFDRPALMIGWVAPRVGESLGLKLNWL